MKTVAKKLLGLLLDATAWVAESDHPFTALETEELMDWMVR